MTDQMGTVDFFALEASDALDRIATLTTGGAAPDADALLRSARLLRGAALMAQQAPVARAAGELESVARAIRSGASAWSPAMQETLGDVVEEFRLLVRRAGNWTEGDTSRANRLARALGALGVRSQGSHSDPASGPFAGANTGVQAFVAREASVVAGALDRAGRALVASPADREPIYAVIRRMQSLRGLAELGDLAPLPELLDGVELALGDLTRSYAPPPGAAEVMLAGAEALARAARDVADDGRPDPDAVEARRFTDLLVRAFAVERDVVPIESLYVRGDAAPISRPDSQPQFALPEAMGPLELVSHGEHLSQSADLISQADSAVQRDLRLYRLIGTLRAAAVPAQDAVAGALAVFARSAREALASGVGANQTDRLVQSLRRAGELLKGAADAPDRMLLSRRLLDAAHELDQLRAPFDEPGVVPIESLLVPETGTDLEIVPIEQLAPDEDADLTVVPIESLAPEDPPGLLEAAFVQFKRLVGLESASSAPEPLAVVEIASLGYRGQAALERAGEVGQELSRALGRGAGLETIRPLLQELLDLVPLAHSGR